ncbi:MAG TPA: hypothetical protein VLX89_09795 [Actinomycetota bacterium]|nr:hypothetical protein [Actinomycetota bacterium]
MRQLRSEYGADLALAAAVVGLGFLVAAVVIYRRREDRAEALAAIARIFAIGGAGLILASSAITVGRPIGGRFGATPGGDVLRTWASDLARFPRTVASILLVANVVLYFLVGLLGVVGWGSEARARIFVACIVLSLYVGFTRFTFVGGIASTDDLILNGLSALLGIFLGTVVDRAITARSVAPLA